MYGLVNKAVRDLIVSNHGTQAWERIRKRAGTPIADFVCMRSYDDDITYRIVAAASEELGESPDALLEAFGAYWTGFTAGEGYRQLLSIAGDTIPEFLCNLNVLHERVGAAMPRLRPPKFDCRVVSPHLVELTYISTREGLTPMMLGLLKGLATLFDTPVRITPLDLRSEGASADRFRVEHGQWLVGQPHTVYPTVLENRA